MFLGSAFLCLGSIPREASPRGANMASSSSALTALIAEQLEDTRAPLAQQPAAKVLGLKPIGSAWLKTLSLNQLL